jgi:hypothetical protein
VVHVGTEHIVGVVRLRESIMRICPGFEFLRRYLYFTKSLKAGCSLWG